MMIIKQRENPKKISNWFIAIMLFTLAFTVYFSQSPLCKLSAATLSDYCYKFDISVQNNTGGNKSYFPVLLEGANMNDWQSNNYIDKFAWSIFPYQASLVDEYQVLLQDIDSLSSNQWYVFPSLSASGTNNLNVLLGATDIQRNQGIFFTGLDYLKVDNHNDFNQSNFEINVEFNDVIQNEMSSDVYTILEKYNESTFQGFKLEIVNNSASTGTGDIYIRGYSDTSTIQSHTFIPSGNEYIEFKLNAGSLDLSVDGTSASTVTGATLTSNTEDMYVGASYNTTLSNYMDNTVIRVIDMVFGGDLVAYYGFNPKDMSETSASNPYYDGLVSDISFSTNTHNANYFFNRDQFGINVVASRIVPATASGSTIFTQETSDIIGRWYGSGNPNNLASTNQNMIGLSFLTPDADLGMPDTVWYSFWLSAVGIAIGIGVFWIFNNTPLAIFGASLPLVLGSMQGLINTWFIVLWFLFFIAIYSTYQWYERS